LFVPIFFVSCIPRKKLLYTQDQKPKELVNEYINIRPEKTIQPFDNIFIKVSSIDEQTANIFATKGSAAGMQNINLLSYTVDGAGYVNFPFVGDIYVKDLTINQAQEKIEEEVGQYLSNISISVKFVNNTVAVLGEVNRPGNHDFYSDQITIFQALSLASGIGDYGNKTNVILVRESQGKINYHYIDLTDKAVVASDYYYLIPNDVLIIRPVRQKYRNLSLINVPLFLTTITTAVTLYFLFRNN
jgi:polysaccharide export outer membrane protein